MESAGRRRRRRQGKGGRRNTAAAEGRGAGRGCKERGKKRDGGGWGGGPRLGAQPHPSQAARASDSDDADNAGGNRLRPGIPWPPPRFPAPVSGAAVPARAFSRSPSSLSLSPTPLLSPTPPLHHPLSLPPPPPPSLSLHPPPPYTPPFPVPLPLFLSPLSPPFSSHSLSSLKPARTLSPLSSRLLRRAEAGRQRRWVGLAAAAAACKHAYMAEALAALE